MYVAMNACFNEV